jgi:LacI family transcriptional regulator
MRIRYQAKKKRFSKSIPNRIKDISAIGSILAFRRAGLRVPEGISVVGFDGIKIAMHNNPSLTTVHQPLEKMGATAARVLLNRIEEHAEWIPYIRIRSELVVRDSAGPAPANVVIGGDKTDHQDVLAPT